MTTLADKKLLIPVWGAVDLTGQQTFPIIPFVVGGLISALGMEVADAGLVVSIEYGCLALVTLGLSPLMGKLNRRSLALTGALIALVANLLCAFSEDALLMNFSYIAGYRALAGIGYGMALAGGNATASNAANPDKLYARKMMLLILYSCTAVIVVPYASMNWGVQGIYGMLFLVSAIAVLLVLNLPSYATIFDANRSDESKVGADLLRILWVCVGIMMLALLFSLRESFAMTFLERIGSTTLDISPQKIGVMLAVGNIPSLGFLAFTGPIILILGYTKAISLPVTISGLLTYGLFVTGSATLFNLMILLWESFFFLSWTLIMSAAASVDPAGRVVAATGGVVLGAYAIGPALAGYIVERSGFEHLATAILVLAGFTLVPAIGVGVYLDKHRKDGDPPGIES